MENGLGFHQQSQSIQEREEVEMRVLVACEFSGVVRDAFLRKGHDALSCDLIETERPGPHYHGNLFDVIDYPWDLAVFHPECTHTSVSGAKHFKEKRLKGLQQRSVSFFMRLIRSTSHIPKTVFEQPISIISSEYRKPDQIIQPWMFGHGETKATCLWLKGLPLLKPTNIVEGRESRVHKEPPSENRWKNRSRTFQGIADAMAEQWSNL